MVPKVFYPHSSSNTQVLFPTSWINLSSFLLVSLMSYVTFDIKCGWFSYVYYVCMRDGNCVYADAILKKYSSTVATIFTGLASAALFGHALTINFLLGVTIVFISMHQVKLIMFLWVADQWKSKSMGSRR